MEANKATKVKQVESYIDSQVKNTVVCRGK